MTKKRIRKSRLWMVISAALLVLSVVGAILTTQVKTKASSYEPKNGNIIDMTSYENGAWVYATNKGSMVSMTKEGTESATYDVAALAKEYSGNDIGTVNKMYQAADSENIWFFSTNSKDGQQMGYLFQVKTSDNDAEVVACTTFDGDLLNIRVLEDEGFLYVITSGKMAAEIYKYDATNLEAGVVTSTILYDMFQSGNEFKCSAIRMPNGINMFEADDNYLYVMYDSGMVRIAKEFADVTYQGGTKKDFTTDKIDTSKYIFFGLRGIASSGGAFERETGKFYVTARNANLYTFDAKKIDSLSIGSTIKLEEVEGIEFKVLPKKDSALFYEARTGVAYMLHDSSNKVTKLNLKEERQEFSFDGAFNITKIVQGASSDDFFYVYSNRYETGQSDKTVLASMDARAKSNETLLEVGFYASMTALLVAVVLLIFLIVVVLRKKEAAALKALKQMRKQKGIYIALLPALVLLILFCYYEAIASIALSFYDYSVDSPTMMWNNFENYKNVFFSANSGEAFGNMIFFLVFDLIVAIVPPVIFAFFLSVMKWERLSNTVRTLLFVANVVPAIAGMMIWRFGIYGGNGVLNTVIGLFNGQAIDFLGQSSYAKWAILMIGFPFVGAYLIFYGGMMNISKSYYEAAELEGIGIWKRFFGIDLPLIMPQMKYVFVTSFIASLQNFQRIYTITAGQSGTKTPIYLMYDNITVGEYGQASAYATVIFILLFGASYLNLRKQKDDMGV